MYEVIVKLYKKAHGTYLRLVKEEKETFTNKFEAEVYYTSKIEEYKNLYEYYDIYIKNENEIIERSKSITISDKSNYPAKMFKEEECENYESKLQFIIENRNFFSMKYICEQAGINYNVYKNTFPKLSKNNVRRIFKIMTNLTSEINEINKT